MATLGIVVSAKDEASGTLAKIKASLESWQPAITGVKDGLDLLKDAWGFTIGAIKGGAEVFAGLIKDAMEAEKAERNLVSALESHGANVDAILPKLKELNDAIETSTGLDGDALAATQAKLLALGVLPKNLQAATVAAAGWARTTGKDMTSAAVDVSKAIHGHTESLKKLGVEAKTSQEALEFMATDGFRALLAEGQTLEGQLNVLEQRIGNFREALGAAGTQSEAAKSAIAALSGFVLQLQNVFGSAEGKAAVNAFFKVLAGGLSTTIELALFAIDTWDEAVQRFRLNTAGFIAEPLTEEGDKTKKGIDAIKAKFHDLARTLDDIAQGGTIKLPEMKMPSLGVTDQSGPDEAAAKALAKRLAAETKAVIDNLKFRGEAEERLQKAKSALAESNLKHRVAIAEREEKGDEDRHKAVWARIDADRAKNASAVAQISAGVTGLRQVFTGVLLDGANLGTSMLGLVRGLAETVIDSLLRTAVESAIAAAAGNAIAKAAGLAEVKIAAAVAGAKAFSAYAAIPIAGPVIGAAAAAAASAATMAFGAGVLLAAEGGLVIGTGNRDTVPALLTPGERVLSVEQNRAFERGGGMTINLSLMAPVSQGSHLDRWMRDTVVPSARRAARRR